MVGRRDERRYRVRRLAIIDRAAALWGLKGYDQVSFEALARAAGFHSARSLRLYYSSRDEVLAELADAHLDRLLAAVGDACEAAGEPRASLVVMARALSAAALEAGARHRLTLLALARLDDGALGAKFRWLEHRFVVAFVAAGAGDLAQAEALASGLVSLVAGGWSTLLGDPPSGYADAAAALALSLVSADSLAGSSAGAS